MEHLLNQRLGFNFVPETLIFTTDLTSDGAPEPAAWVMLLLGFGLSGAAIRARRRRAVAA